VSAVIFACEPPVSADDAYLLGVVCRDFEVLDGVLEVDIVMQMGLRQARCRKSTETCSITVMNP
jgi:hypothetical protein